MPRIALQQLFAEYPVTIDRYCSTDGREDRQNVMMMSCAAWAIEEGYDVQVRWDNEGELDRDGLCAVFIVLFSVAAYQLANAISEFKQIHNCRVIVCGPHAVSFPEHCYRAGADAVVGRCNRDLFISILNDIGSNTLKPYYATEKPTVSFPHHSRFRELGLVPKQNFMNLVTSTGCPFTCDFCTDADTRYAPVGVADVLENIRSCDEPMVVFNDPTFGVGQAGRALMEGLRDIADRHCIAFTTSSMLRDVAFRRLMGQAGFVLVEVGVENINSKFAKNKNTEFFETFSDCDFLLLVNYIWGYDTRDLDGSTLAFLTDLTIRCPNVFPIIFAPFSLPETALHKMQVAEGRIFDPTYLCIGNEILSMRVEGAASPKEYCRRLAELRERLYDGHAGRMRAWIEGHPRIDPVRKMAMLRMVDRHLKEATALDQWADHIAAAAPDAYIPFGRDVMRRAIPGFDRYELALDVKTPKGRRLLTRATTA